MNTIPNAIPRLRRFRNFVLSLLCLSASLGSTWAEDAVTAATRLGADQMLQKMGLSPEQQQKFKALQKEFRDKLAALQDQPEEQRRAGSIKALDEFLQQAKEQNVLTEEQIATFKKRHPDSAPSPGATATPSPGSATKQPQGAGSKSATVGPAPTKENMAYGPHPLNVLDFWQAKSDKPTPVVVYMHGGSFIYGDKVKIRDRNIIATYLSKGISFASIDYRRRKDAPIQDILRDAARAIQYLRANAEALNIDKPRIAMYGESAGAGTALWLGSHPDLADPNSSDPILRESSRIAAACCVDGQCTYDITKWEPLVGQFKPEWLLSPDEIPALYYFKTEADFQTSEGKKVLEDCDMLHWLSRDSAPIFMFSGVLNVDPKIRQDFVHHPRHMFAVKQQCDKVGAECVVVTRESLGSPVEHNQLLLAFLLKHLKAE